MEIEDGKLEISPLVMSVMTSGQNDEFMSARDSVSDRGILVIQALAMNVT